MTEKIEPLTDAELEDVRHETGFFDALARSNMLRLLATIDQLRAGIECQCVEIRRLKLKVDELEEDIETWREEGTFYE
jgi:hypothetical protein